MTSFENNICGYLIASGFFMGGLGILIMGIAIFYDQLKSWEPDDKKDEHTKGEGG